MPCPGRAPDQKRRCARFTRYWRTDDASLGHELLALLDREGEGDLVLSSPTERLAVLRRFLAALATDRPVVLWLDELERSFEAMANRTCCWRPDRW